MLPRHLKDPLTMIASLVHSASHSSILYCIKAAFLAHRNNAICTYVMSI